MLKIFKFVSTSFKFVVEAAGTVTVSFALTQKQLKMAEKAGELYETLYAEKLKRKNAETDQSESEGYSTNGGRNIDGVVSDLGDFRPLKIGCDFDGSAGLQHEFFTPRPNLVIKQ